MRLRPQVRFHEAIEYLKTQIQQVDIVLDNVHGPDAIEKYLDWTDRASRELPDRFADSSSTRSPIFWSRS